jgi:hypothetical protein
MIATLCTLLLFTLPAEAPKPATVPFELLKTKHMVVQIKINGKGPYRVIFDTGAPVMLVNNKVAKASGLVGKNAQTPLFALFGNMGNVKIKTLEIGDLRAENVAAVVMDHPTIELISKFLGPIDGIVGFPFFARYKMTVDYQAKELTFVPSGYEPPDAMEAMMKSMMALTGDDGKPKVLAPAAQWGLIVEKKDQDEEAGVTVKDVRPGSSAEQAGLKAGDRLLTLDGRWTDSVADTYRAVEYVKPGTSTMVKIKRGSDDIELTVKPRAGF